MSPLACLCLLAACGGAAGSAQRPPNLLLAIADDLDPDHPGFAGNPAARTPSLDRLAAEGCYFPVLYVQPVCRAAHAVLLTGRFPHETGIRNNRTDAVLAPLGLLPQRLKERGYATFCAGKFWEGDPRDYGFDAAVSDRAFARGGPGSQQELFRFLEERAGAGPWFLWWAPNLPHVPHEPPARLAEAFRDAPVTPPPGYGGDPARYAAEERACLAMEAWLDEAFGALVGKLEALGEREETLIVFLADNGWSSASPSKGTPREKGVRSPLVVSLPGKERGARRLDALVALPDVHATLLDYAGADPEGRGTSLRPLLEGRPAGTRTALHGSVFLRGREDGSGGELCALYTRDARWKYTLYVRAAEGALLSAGSGLAPPFRHPAGAEELFDLAHDPFELTNLATAPEHAARRAALREAVLDWWRATGGEALELPTPGGH
jgi:uncharacterized sulfatase